MDVLILIALIVLNGVFAMSEIAIVMAKKSRLAALADKGRTSAGVALRMAENPTQFLSTVQIGITSIGIMNGIFGESVLAEPFAQWLHQIGMSQPTSSTVATLFVVVVVTYVTIVVGELVPKRIGQVSAEAIACVVARPMSWLAVVAKPFVMLLSYSTHGLLRILRFQQTEGDMVTEEDIHALLQEGSTSGVIEHGEHAMVRNVLRLDARPITSLMVPRGDMVVLDATLPLEENYRRVLQSPHSAFPLWDRQAGTPIGVVHAKEMLAQVVTGEALDLSALAKPCHYVLENLTALKLLDYFKSADTQLVLVVDEYGDVQGLVTVHDLLEALTGEFGSSDDEEAWVVTREDGSLLIDGLLPIMDLKDRLGIVEFPDEGSYQTLNGLIMKIMDRVPVTGEYVVLQGWRLEIVDMDGHRIDKVLASSTIKGRDEGDDG